MASQTKADSPGDPVPVVLDRSADTGPAQGAEQKDARRPKRRASVSVRRQGDPLAATGGSARGAAAASVAGAFAAVGAGIRSAARTVRDAFTGRPEVIAPVACKVCGRKLTGKKSRAAGMGKRCTVKLHAAEQTTFQPQQGSDDADPSANP